MFQKHHSLRLGVLSLSCLLSFGLAAAAAAQEEDEAPEVHVTLVVEGQAEEVPYHTVEYDPWEPGGGYGHHQDEVPGDDGGPGGGSSRPSVQEESQCVRDDFCDAIGHDFQFYFDNPHEARAPFNAAVAACDSHREFVFLRFSSYSGDVSDGRLLWLMMIDDEPTGCLLEDGSIGWLCGLGCFDLCPIGTRANPLTCECDPAPLMDGDICGEAVNGRPQIMCGGVCREPCPIGYWLNPDFCSCEANFDPFYQCDSRCEGMIDSQCSQPGGFPPTALINDVADLLGCDSAEVEAAWREMMGANCLRIRALCERGFPGSCYDWAEDWRVGDPKAWPLWGSFYNEGFFEESVEDLMAYINANGFCWGSAPPKPPEKTWFSSQPAFSAGEVAGKGGSERSFRLSWDYPAVESVTVSGHGTFPGGAGAIDLPTHLAQTLHFTVHNLPSLGLPPNEYDMVLNPVDPADFLVVTPAVVQAGQPVTLDWFLPGASSVTVVGLGSYAGARGSAVVYPATSSTYSVYGHYPPHHETRWYTEGVEVVGSGPAPEHFGVCFEPCSTSTLVPGYSDLHYCRHVRSADGAGGNDTARWIRVSDFESLVGPAAQPASSYCFEASCGDGSYAPFRYHSPGTEPALWVMPSALPAESCGDGVDNDCDGQIDEGCPVCTTGDRRCVGGSQQLCENGQWGTTLACLWGCDPATRACFPENPACLGRPSPCDNQGATFCSSIQPSVVSCVPDADGCLQWQITENCPNGCHLGACVPDGPSCPWGSGSCSVQGERRCTSATGYQSCTLDTDDCLRWTAQDSGQCNGAAGEVCNSGTCEVVSCWSNSDCSGSTRFCSGGRCQPCTSDADCSTAYACSSDGRCQAAF